MNITITPNAWFRSDRILYNLRYVIVASSDQEEAISITCTYAVSYRITDPDEFAKEDIAEDVEAFGSSAVPYTLHPYVRELVYDLSGKAGLPPLILGEMHLPAQITKLLSRGLRLDAESRRK
jgi:preprotein translocase subunit SecB